MTSLAAWMPFFETGQCIWESPFRKVKVYSQHKREMPLNSAGIKKPHIHAISKIQLHSQQENQGRDSGEGVVGVWNCEVLEPQKREPPNGE